MIPQSLFPTRSSFRLTLALAMVVACRALAETPERIDNLERQAILLESRAKYGEAAAAYLEELRELAAIAPKDDATRHEIGARGEFALLRVDPLIHAIDGFRAADEALGDVISRPIDPILRARAVVSRWSYERSRSDVPPPGATPDGIGSLTDWMLIGPFDNEQGGGFERDFPPEHELKLGATYDGKDRQVSWRRVPVAGKAAVNLAATFTPNEQCLAYALCAVHCERETPVALRLATSGAVKVFVNGAPFSAPTHRRASFLSGSSSIAALASGNSPVLRQNFQ